MGLVKTWTRARTLVITLLVVMAVAVAVTVYAAQHLIKSGNSRIYVSLFGGGIIPTNYTIIYVNSSTTYGWNPPPVFGSPPFGGFIPPLWGFAGGFPINGTLTVAIVGFNSTSLIPSIDVIIYNSNGSSAIRVSGPVVREPSIDKSIDYYVIALRWVRSVSGNTWTPEIGYAEVSGEELSEIMGGGLRSLYQWVIANIRLKPLSEYPVSTVRVIVKAPNGELINGGRVCAAPAIPLLVMAAPHMLTCAPVSNGVAYLRLPSIPYIMRYIEIYRLSGNSTVVSTTHEVINVYGYPVNVTVTKEVVYVTNPSIILILGEAITVPSNNTVEVLARVVPVPGPVLYGPSPIYAWTLYPHPIGPIYGTLYGVNTSANTQSYGYYPVALPPIVPTGTNAAIIALPAVQPSNAAHHAMPSDYLVLTTIVVLAVIVGTVVSIIVAKMVYRAGNRALGDGRE